MSQQGTAHQTDPRYVVPRLLARLGEVLGEEACRAMFHYAAVQEGRQAGSKLPRGELVSLVAHLDHLLGHASKILGDTGSEVRLEVRHSALLAIEEEALHEIVVGFVEGALTSFRGKTYSGRVDERLGDPDATTTLSFEAQT